MRAALDEKKARRKRAGKLLALHGIVILAILLYLFLLNYFSIGCPIRSLTGIPCPTCGVTRALLSLLRLDFAGYFRYNPMAVPLCVAIFLAFHEKLLRIGLRWFLALIIGTAVLTFVVYLIRLKLNIIL